MMRAASRSRPVSHVGGDLITRCPYSGVAVMKLGTLIWSAQLGLLALLGGPAALAQDAAPAATAAPDLKYSNKWRIEVKEGANNDGVARFRVTPRGEAAIEVTVNVKDGRSENGVAQDVKKAFSAALDKKRFKVEGDDFEDVLVKSKSGPDFSLELVESTLKGTHFDLERE
jgi:hypothetical protein